MAHDLLTRAIPLLAQYGYAALLPVAVVEGPAMAMVAGALVAAGQMNAVIAFLLLVAADLVGDAAYYGLGRFGHAPLVGRISRRLSRAAERLRPLEQRFRDNDWKLLMIGKAQAFGSLILYFAGVSRTPFVRFLALNLAATIPKVILFQVIGYFFGRSILQSVRYIDYIAIGLFALALVLFVVYLIVTRRLWKKVVGDLSV